mmetsp:Transcript_10965/g.24158  ORF Transcript_10965/g.24158 Transcript_10965/m.24158 type:complete len:257 (+) Transcript_10965:50-820(+)
MDPRVAEISPCDAPDLQRVICPEGQRAIFEAPEEASERLVRAWFGDKDLPLEVGPGLGMDCSDLVRQRILKFRQGVQASRACLKEDPAPGKGKVLIFDFCRPVSCSISEKRLTTHSRAEDVVSFPEWVAFVRHAQALHNVDEALTQQRDNPLTPFGREQAAAASVGESGKALRSAELVVTSPLHRALETTALLLQGEDAAEVPVLVSPLVAERWSAPCDEGTAKSELLPKLSQQMRSWEGWDAMPEEWWAEPGRLA